MSNLETKPPGSGPGGGDFTNSKIGNTGGGCQLPLDNQFTDEKQAAIEATPDEPIARPLKQVEIDWLIKSGVEPEAIINPDAMMAVDHGEVDRNGLLQSSVSGRTFLAFSQDTQLIFWQPKTGQLAQSHGGIFALGEEQILDPARCAETQFLEIYADPLDWLKSGRQGIVILDWKRAWLRLQDAPRILVAETVLDTFERHFKPRMPVIKVRLTPKVVNLAERRVEKEGLRHG